MNRAVCGRWYHGIIRADLLGGGGFGSVGVVGSAVGTLGSPRVVGGSITGGRPRVRVLTLCRRTPLAVGTWKVIMLSLSSAGGGGGGELFLGALISRCFLFLFSLGSLYQVVVQSDGGSSVMVGMGVFCLVVFWWMRFAWRSTLGAVVSLDVDGTSTLGSSRGSTL